MCLAGLRWRVRAGERLALAANRDEFYARPTAALHRWEDAPQVLGGRDLQDGGTWLGVAAGGRVAFVTNVRAPALIREGRASRGWLVRDFLVGQVGAAEYAAAIAERARRGELNPFNLFCADAQALWYVHAAGDDVEARDLAPGTHAVSNGRVDEPWGKMQRVRAAMVVGDGREALADRSLDADFELPATGVSLELERQLSACFVLLPQYGTRASTWLRVGEDGGIEVEERVFGEGGRELSRRMLRG